MPAGADTLRAVAQTLGPGLGIGDKLADGFRRARRRHHQDIVESDQRRDRLEVLDRIELQVGVERRVDRVCAGVAHHQEIAVRRRVLDRDRGDIAGRTGAILDDDRLLERLGRLAGDQPHHDVGAAAWRERDQDRDRTRRIVVGARGRSERQTRHRGDRDQAGLQELPIHRHQPYSNAPAVTCISYAVAAARRRPSIIDDFIR